MNKSQKILVGIALIGGLGGISGFSLPKLDKQNINYIKNQIEKYDPILAATKGIAILAEENLKYIK